ncbi:nascent polypeptide-associated complex subunit beta-1 [Monosporozyma unispora]|nr:Nascent polypeptide-associated complex subunit beta [Kazachstania unispora]
MPIDPAKLAKLQKLSATGKVGGTRRKQVKKPHVFADEPKLLNEMTKFGAVTIDDVVEANFFQEDGNVLHFDKVKKFEYAPKYNVSAVFGKGVLKPLDDMFQEVLPQLGPEAYYALSQLDEKVKEFEDAKKAEEEAKKAEENK